MAAAILDLLTIRAGIAIKNTFQFLPASLFLQKQY